MSDCRLQPRCLIAMMTVTAALAIAPPASGQQSADSATHGGRLFDDLFAYLNVAGSKSDDFKPLTQRERNRLFGKSLINPVWYVKGAISAGLNQWNDVPEGWEQGASGYGKRYGDIMGQYAIRKTVMFGLESLFHEDNQYYPSHKQGFWPRTGYALSSGMLARQDNGKRHPSVSLLVGYASGSYLSRFWQPADTRTVGDAAVSFGVSMGWNIGLGVAKEFLPDILRPFTRKKKSGAAPTTSGVGGAGTR